MLRALFLLLVVLSLFLGGAASHRGGAGPTPATDGGAWPAATAAVRSIDPGFTVTGPDRPIDSAFTVDGPHCVEVPMGGTGSFGPTPSDPACPPAAGAP